MLRLLTDAVDYGIAQPASIPDFSVAGKTGSPDRRADRAVRTGTDAHGKPSTRRPPFGYRRLDRLQLHLLLPASDPKIVTLLLIHRPATWGLYQMAQRPDDLFRDLAPDILSYLAIPPDRPAQPVASR